jgi:DNA-binding NarL/FixJ family response regulator
MLLANCDLPGGQEMEPISVMLVDDNPVFLRATTQFLEAHDDVVVIGTASRGDEALERIKDLKPQTVLIDLAMPGLSGLATIPHLRHLMPEVGIIALTVMNSEGFRHAALIAGADVFIPKAIMRTHLLPAIRELARGDRKGAAEKAAPRTGTASNELRRVLIMEDDKHLRYLYSKALHKAGYKVHPAGTIEEARNLLANFRFDVLLCDIQMGSDRGTDLLHEHIDDITTSGAQVVMVSGHPHYREACAEMGADFFLEKPVSVGTLVMLVNRLTAHGGCEP